MKSYYVYILTNKFNTVLYVGITDNLNRRTTEHTNALHQGFTKRYRAHKLVYYERYSNVLDAISREKQLKGWTRDKKRKLVEKRNPDWNDWSEGFV